MRMRDTILTALGTALLAGTAQAVVTSWWTEVAIPKASQTDSVTPSPGLAGYRTYDLMIQVFPGDDFQSMRIFWDPPTPIFQHAHGNNTPALHFAPPDPAMFPAFPALEFDSYVQGPAGFMYALGSTDGTNDLPPPAIFDTDKIAFAGGDTVVDPTGGVFRLLRITMQPGIWTYRLITIGQIFSAQNPSGIPIVVSEMVVPEPASISVMVGAWLLARRMRSSRGAG